MLQESHLLALFASWQDIQKELRSIRLSISLLVNVLKIFYQVDITNTLVTAMLASKQRFRVRYLISIYFSTCLLSNGLRIALLSRCN